MHFLIKIDVLEVHIIVIFFHFSKNIAHFFCECA